MEEQTQHQEILDPGEIPSSSKKSQFKLAFFGLFFAVVIAAVAFGAYSMGAQKSNKHFPIDAESIAEVTPTLSRTLPTPESTNENGGYALGDIGLSFTLPSRVQAGGMIKEVKVASNPLSTGSLFCARVAKPQTTPIPFPEDRNTFVCYMQENDLIIIGGTSPDFSDGREGTITDFQGFVYKDGKYLARFVGENNFSDVTEIAEPVKNPNGVEIIKLRGIYQEGPTPWPSENQIAAIVNTKDSTFRGISLLVNLEDIDEETFDQILSTFRFIQ